MRNHAGRSVGEPAIHGVGGTRSLAVRLFAAVGKLKGVVGIDCVFRGEDKAIQFTGGATSPMTVTGLLMPMRRLDKPKEEPATGEQMEHEA